jgi:hypothetical protein
MNGALVLGDHCLVAGGGPRHMEMRLLLHDRYGRLKIMQILALLSETTQ